MTTTDVEHHAHDLLQEIAENLAKARKIIVMTGAGISTNTGIPVRRALDSLIESMLDLFHTDVFSLGLPIQERALFSYPGTVRSGSRKPVGLLQLHSVQPRRVSNPFSSLRLRSSEREPGNPSQAPAHRADMRNSFLDKFARLPTTRRREPIRWSR